MSLAVIIIGNFVSSISRINSGIPPLSVVFIPSASSTKIIFPCFVRDFCSIAGFKTSSNLSLFLKSEAFSSKISESVSTAATRARVVFPVPGGP